MMQKKKAILQAWKFHIAQRENVGQWGQVGLSKFRSPKKALQ